MIIHAWIEPESPEQLRVRLRITADVSAGIERTVTLTRADAVCEMVKEWLADLQNHTSPPE